MTYPIGTVVIGQNMVRPQSQHRNGMEGVVVGPLMMRTGINKETGRPEEAKQAYLVHWSDGRTTQAKPNRLRRKQPPSGEQSILAMFPAPATARTNNLETSDARP